MAVRPVVLSVVLVGAVSCAPLVGGSWAAAAPTSAGVVAKADPGSLTERARTAEAAAYTARARANQARAAANKAEATAKAASRKARTPKAKARAKALTTRAAKARAEATRLERLATSAEKAAQTARTTERQDWLGRLNLIRSWAGVPPVTEDAALSAADAAHVRYVDLNPGTGGHYEEKHRPGYSDAGHEAATRSNLIRSSGAIGAPADSIDGWAAAPFHSAGMIDSQLVRVGFATGRTNAALDVMSGRDAPFPESGYPRVWPRGTDIDLFTYSGNESPDPVRHCGAEPKSGWGLPLIVDFGKVQQPGWFDRQGRPWYSAKGREITTISVDLRAGTRSVPTCIGLSKDYGGFLNESTAFVIPREALTPSTRYTGTVTTNQGTVDIDFTTARSSVH